MAKAVRDFVSDYSLLSCPAKLRKNGALFVKTCQENGVEEGVVVFSVHTLAPGLVYRTVGGNLVVRSEKEVVLTRGDRNARLSFPLPPKTVELTPDLEKKYFDHGCVPKGGVYLTDRATEKGRLVCNFADLPLDEDFESELGSRLRRVSDCKMLYNDQKVLINDMPSEPMCPMPAGPDSVSICASPCPDKLDLHLKELKLVSKGEEEDAEADAEAEAEAEEEGKGEKAKLPRPCVQDSSLSTKLASQVVEPKTSRPQHKTYAIGFPVTMKVLGGGRCRVTISLTTKRIRLRRKHQLLASEHHGRYMIVEDLHDPSQFTLIISKHTYHFTASSPQRRLEIISTIRFFCSSYSSCFLAGDTLSPTLLDIEA